jgi:hypothetical protein
MGTVQDPNNRTSPAPDAPKANPSLLNRIFLRIKEVFLLGGIGLIVIACIVAGSVKLYPTGVSDIGGLGLSCGLAVAGGLCFVATALVHSREDGRP